MGPIWFFEGFALFAADQFENSTLVLTKDEIIEIIGNEERGSYEKYAFIFRYILNKLPLQELVTKAGDQNFTDFILRHIE